MLLWRIGSNSLPTKERITRAEEVFHLIPFELCRQENETSQHIFFKCPVARAIWYSSCWGFKSEEHQIMNCEDIIKITLTPPKAYCPAEDQWLIPLNMAIVIDEIWYLKNQVQNQCAEINIEESFKRVRH